MRTLSVDPGKTTGVALLLLDSTGWLHTEATLNTYDYDGLFIDRLVGALDLDLLVIEKPPAQGRDLELVGLYSRLLEIGSVHHVELAVVHPSQWKPVMKVLNTAPPAGTRHTKDAWLMGYFELRKRGLL